MASLQQLDVAYYIILHNQVILLHDVYKVAKHTNALHRDSSIIIACYNVTKHTNALHRHSSIIITCYNDRRIPMQRICMLVIYKHHVTG